MISVRLRVLKGGKMSGRLIGVVYGVGKPGTALGVLVIRLGTVPSGLRGLTPTAGVESSHIILFQLNCVFGVSVFVCVGGCRV